MLARVETEKRISLIRAWEESEKSQAENKLRASFLEFFFFFFGLNCYYYFVSCVTLALLLLSINFLVLNYICRKF